MVCVVRRRKKKKKKKKKKKWKKKGGREEIEEKNNLKEKGALSRMTNCKGVRGIGGIPALKKKRKKIKIEIKIIEKLQEKEKINGTQGHHCLQSFLHMILGLK